MPKVSRFLGIDIVFRYNDHSPPHFHAQYNGKDASFDIRTLERLNGNLPPRVVGLVLEWADMHRKELMDNWERAKANRSVKDIAPLVE